jgi:hypothetical protein
LVISGNFEVMLQEITIAALPVMPVMSAVPTFSASQSLHRTSEITLLPTCSRIRQNSDAPWNSHEFRYDFNPGRGETLH